MSEGSDFDRPFVYEVRTQVNVRYEGKDDIVAIITTDTGRYRLEQTTEKGFVLHELNTLAHAVGHVHAIGDLSVKGMAEFQAEMHEVFYKDMDQDAVEKV